MTPEERAAHEKRRRWLKPGTPAERDMRRRDRAEQKRIARATTETRDPIPDRNKE